MKIRVIVSILILFIAFISVIFTLFGHSIPIQAAAASCSYNSGITYNLGDTTNATNGQSGFNPDEFYNLEKYYNFNTTSADLSVSKDKFSNSQIDGNGYDMYPKLASVIGFIPTKLNNTYYLKHKTKIEDQTSYPIVAVDITPGTPIKVPDSGYRILNGTDLAGMLMWTDGNSFVFQIGRADNPRNIFLYVFDVCVDQALVDAYNKGNAAGRNQLPELHIGQVIAKASGNTLRLGFRDGGKFVENRSPYVWDTQYQKSLINNTAYTGYSSDQTRGSALPKAGGTGGGGDAVPTNITYTVNVTLDDGMYKQLQVVFFSNANPSYPSIPKISITVKNSTGTINQTIDAAPNSYTTGSQLSWSIPITIGPQDNALFTAEAVITYSKETAVNLCQDSCKSNQVVFSADNPNPALTIPITKLFPITYAFSIPDKNTALKAFFSKLAGDPSFSVCFLTTNCFPGVIDGPTSKDNSLVYVITITDPAVSQYSLQKRSELNCFKTQESTYCYR